LKLSRQEEVDYLAKEFHILGKKKHNIPLTKDCGEQVLAETLTSHQALPSNAIPLNGKRGEEKVTLEFERRINCCKWHKDKPSANIVTLEKLANAYAIVRHSRR
jgi:argininosuccinate synthase